MIRISSGSLKGKTLIHKAYRSIRPTQSIIREALFDIIGNSIDACRFLDLFAGTGTVGIEAFSRGADEVVFVECNPKLTLLLNQQITRLHLRATVIKSPYQSALKYLNKKKDPFDYIYMDPPYSFENYTDLIESILQKSLLTEEGVLIVERPSERHSTSQVMRTKKYGKSSLDFYKKIPASQTLQTTPCV